MLQEPEYHQHEEYKNRLRKIEEIEELGVDPYPHHFTPTHKSKDLHMHYGEQPVGSSEEAEAGTTDFVTVGGRMLLFRAMGKNAFAQLQDSSGKIQVMFNKKETKVAGYTPENANVAQPPSPIKFIEKKFDLGDILGVEGHLFRTQKGELTIFVKKVTLLSKTLLPLPDKHSGLVDMEVRYRKRWLDLIANDQVRETFKLRSKILRIIRDYCDSLDFLEVETPILQSIYGGAAARPFTTTFHALDDQETFLRIALEIPLKKLLVGGVERVFEIGRVFRNESIDRTHNPEFTMLEAYASYWDYHDMMAFMENLFEKIALELFGSTVVPMGVKGEEGYVEIDMKAPWPRLTMAEAIKKFTGVDVFTAEIEEIRSLLRETGKYEEADLKKATLGVLTAHLFEEKVEEHLIQPHHIIDHPLETTPLCKLHRDPEERKKGIIERFESYVNGNEICNAYSELNDPIKQRELLQQQSEKLQAGDDEANPLDEEFLEALCQGMPPAGGIGIGIDRLVMLFTSSLSIRDVLYFPFMKNETQKAVETETLHS